ncbi:hypothetical protein FISHEDRAFT_20220, partial [Fistulina hepatica ATCC 64428]
PKAWLLDVASPTWEDIRSIGKLLHLHPLTLEDILRREPREKFEHYTRLGYHFVSFRTIESRAKGSPLHTLEGEIGEANVYLVVSKEGACVSTILVCFVLMTGEEHIDRVRNRIFKLDEVASMSSEWISHSILDSIVDSFFPYLEEIEKEVLTIEDIIFLWARLFPQSAAGGSGSGPPMNPTSTTLHRMARTRRLVTQLLRLLGVKSEVVARITKRLLTSEGSLSVTDGRAGDATKREIGQAQLQQQVEIAIYMGDVQDHILTLHHAFADYERALSQAHPLYLSQLRTGVAMTKQGTDKELMRLSSISIGVLLIQTLIGVCSMNVNIPKNRHAAGSPFNAFGIVIAIGCVFTAMYLTLVWWWWQRAKGKRGAAL